MRTLKMASAGLAIALATTATASARAPETLLVLSGITGTIEVTPGLCFPGVEALGCSPVERAEARLTLATCRADGTFEGRTVENGSCDQEQHAFMEAAVPGLAPGCATSRTYSSDEVTAFGPAVNAMTVDGAPRASAIAYPFRVDGVINAVGTVDRGDGRLDPNEDLRLVMHLRVRPADFPAACTSAPAVLLEIQAGSAEIAG